MKTWRSPPHGEPQGTRLRSFLLVCLARFCFWARWGWGVVAPGRAPGLAQWNARGAGLEGRTPDASRVALGTSSLVLRGPLAPLVGLSCRGLGLRSGSRRRRCRLGRLIGSCLARGVTPRLVVVSRCAALLHVYGSCLLLSSLSFLSFCQQLAKNKAFGWDCMSLAGKFTTYLHWTCKQRIPVYFSY